MSPGIELPLTACNAGNLNPPEFILFTCAISFTESKYLCVRFRLDLCLSFWVSDCGGSVWWRSHTAVLKLFPVLQIIWFRVVRRRSQSHCVSFTFKPFEHKFCDGFQNGNFEMSCNIFTVFLKIKEANSSDPGLYFCGYYISKNTVIINATYLEVQGKTVVTFGLSFNWFGFLMEYFQCNI